MPLSEIIDLAVKEQIAEVEIRVQQVGATPILGPWSPNREITATRGTREGSLDHSTQHTALWAVCPVIQSSRAARCGTR